MQDTTKDSEQAVMNKSFDPTYQTQQVEILGYDSGVLRPIAVTDTGLVKVTI